MNEPGRRAVFLDRDGVLNAAVLHDGRPHPPARPDDVEIIAGVVEACRRLDREGWLLVVVTNQPDIARGATSMAEVAAINARVVADLPVAEVVVCPHDDGDACACRKPEPGMILEAAKRWKVDLAQSFMVGDRWRDIEAGRRAGARTVFIDYGYAEQRPSEPDHVVRSLTEAVDQICALGGVVR